MKKGLISYFIYVLILVVLSLLLFSYCKKSLLEYESSLPEYVMDNVVASLAHSSISTNDISEFSIREFDSYDLYIDIINEELNHDLSYKYVKENYSDGSIIYDIYSGETAIASCSLIPSSSHKRMYILTITDWTLNDITFIQPDLPVHKYTITAPDGYSVYLDGQLLGEESLIEQTDIPELSYCAEYVDVPTMNVYETSEMVSNCEISYDDNMGNHYIVESNDKYDIVINYSSSEMPEDMYNQVIANAKRYSGYFTLEIEGALDSIDPIRDLFPANSDYLRLADDFRQHEMSWVYASVSGTYYDNESVTDYIVYNDQCFSCHINIDKHSKLYGTQDLDDNINGVYYYVLLNGRWVIADIR